VFLGALVFISCRDKGEYSYSGILLDSCGVNPIANAEVFVNAGQSGDRSTTTNANGYFKISGKWNEDGGFLSKPVFPSMSIIDSQNKRVLEWDNLPEGEHQFGDFTGWTKLRIPIKLDTSAYFCAACTFSFQITSKVNFVQYGWVSDFPNGVTSGMIECTIPLFIDATNNTVDGPVVLYYTRYDSVSFAYPEIDISPFLKLCGISDTVAITL
jgi:hypothetical protein